jgi:hypothetical protein
MKEDKDQPRKVSTCFEELPCAEMMPKVPGQKAIGSLCEEIMRSLMKERRKSGEGPHETKKKEAPEEKINKNSSSPKARRKINKQEV